MTDRTDPKVLAELRELMVMATPGEWKLFGMSVVSDPKGTSDIDDAITVANTVQEIDGHPRTYDASLIALLRNHAASLLADSERLGEAEKERDQYKTTAEHNYAVSQNYSENLQQQSSKIAHLTERLRLAVEGLELAAAKEVEVDRGPVQREYVDKLTSKPERAMISDLYDWGYARGVRSVATIARDYLAKISETE